MFAVAGESRGTKSRKPRLVLNGDSLDGNDRESSTPDSALSNANLAAKVV